MMNRDPMIDIDNCGGSPIVANDPKPDPADVQAELADNIRKLQVLRQTVDDLEGMARSLKATQRRAGVRVID